MEVKIVEAVVKTIGELYRTILARVRLSRLSNPQTFIVVLLIVILPCLLLGYWIWTTREKPARLTYRGTVSTATKQPIKDAEVTVLGRADIGPRLTDAQGFFTLELPAREGRFQGTLRVRHADYEVAEQKIEVRAETTGEPILLAPKAPPEREWSGAVRDERGPVAGVTVSVEGVAPTAQTGPDGRFSLKAATAQTAGFVLRAEKPGYPPWRDFIAPRQDITITLGKDKE